MVDTKRTRVLPALAVLLLHAVDRAALVAVKAAFNNASYFASWTPDIPCCAWPSVGCQGSTGRVVSLDILLDDGVAAPVPGHATTGSTATTCMSRIPALLANLTDVSYNRFCGAVPDGAAARFGIHSLEHNRCLCGNAPLPKPCQSPRN